VKAARRAAGYSLVEVMIVTGLVALAAAIAVPTIGATMRRYALTNAAQQVASVVRSARYTAVSKNKVVRVRFNCPESGQFRLIEVTANNTIDQAADRCSNATYPYPDPDPAAAPNVDGPVLVTPPDTEFDSATDIEISEQGRLTTLTGCPMCVSGGGSALIVLGNGSESQTVTVGATGQVTVGPVVPN
jgi:type II secretory pathway pseudopilin PulG